MLKKTFICLMIALCLSSHPVQATETEPAAPAQKDTPEQAEIRRKTVEQLDKMTKDLEALQKSMGQEVKDMNESVDKLQKANDAMMVLGLTGLHIRQQMMEHCGLTGPDADKVMANDKAAAEKFQASISEEAKKTYAGQTEAMDAQLKTEWDKAPEDKRAKSCEGIKASVAKEAAK